MTPWSQPVSQNSCAPTEFLNVVNNYTKVILMAINFFWIFTESKPVRGLRKIYNIPEVNWLNNTQ